MFLFLIFTFASKAQTIYKSDSGLFTPIVKTLYLRNDPLENTQLIGPAIGYRFNKNYDLTLHVEYLSTSYDLNNDFKLSLLNLGFILGRTRHLSSANMLRSKLSVYHSFTFGNEGLPTNFQDPSLNSVLFSTSFYHQLGSSGSVSFLPNVGAFLGYGDYQPAYSSASLRQGFDGFVFGPRLGFDVSFQLSDSFYLIINPDYQLRVNPKYDNSVGSLLINIQLNF